jgi:oligoribonuclease NrnB/cAMP/cGMP phosphodiesterase (DHH superfamily)
MKCFYHADADGRCAGFWVRLNVGLNDIGKYETEFIEINYGKPFPFEKIGQGEQVYIVDYSIEPAEMLRLLEITQDVTWIDHHKTAIEKYTDFPYAVRGVRYDGVAGCMLAYCYIHHMTDRGAGDIKPFDMSMTEDAPQFTKLIADWDVWKFKYGDDTRHFIAAFNAYDFKPESKLWDRFFAFPDEMACGSLIQEGMTMTAYRDGWAKEYCRTKGFETVIGGHRAFALNLGNCNSEYFKSISGYEILMPFCFDGDKWTVSLYSKTVDVSEIAKKFGGGGHKGASGFQCKQLPFIKAVQS